MKACSGGIDPEKLVNNFEVFGMDFMIDANYNVWLIEVNSNPCLELSCPLLGSIIPKMV
jgi:tubulin polyglutamylase TTLL1